MGDLQVLVGLDSQGELVEVHMNIILLRGSLSLVNVPLTLKFIMI